MFILNFFYIFTYVYCIFLVAVAQGEDLAGFAQDGVFAYCSGHPKGQTLY